MQKTILFLLALASALPSCGGRNNPNARLSDHIAGMQQASGQRAGASRAPELIATVFPVPRSEFRQGDQVPIGYTPASDTLRIDSTVLWLNDRRTGLIENGQWIHMSGTNDPVGRTAYRIVAHGGADSTVRVGEFTLKAKEAPAVYGYREIAAWPHDPTAYTQGLYWHDGYFYEGTGLEGQSSLRKVDPATGAVLQKIDLDKQYFGEGIALLGGKIYQLTWQHSLGFIYDAETFRQVGDFRYTGQGWGLTTDGTYLYMSNGSERIEVIDPDGFKKHRTIEVCTDQEKVDQLNELEWIEGEIWANVYLTDRIVRIDPATGAVTGVIDLSGLLKTTDKDIHTDVLNGIAYDASTRRIFVTGKNWKKLFEIQVKP
jgi:glutamine cyclotransferase